MLFCSCFSVPCQTIVACASGRCVTTCPSCGRTLRPLVADSGPPMGFDRATIEPLVATHGAAGWRVAVRCGEPWESKGPRSIT
jgi:hypothetical protein